MDPNIYGTEVDRIPKRGLRLDDLAVGCVLVSEKYLQKQKPKLFYKCTGAFGVVHQAGGLVQILEDRVSKIMQWNNTIDPIT